MATIRAVMAQMDKMQRIIAASQAQFGAVQRAIAASQPQFEATQRAIAASRPQFEATQRAIAASQPQFEATQRAIAASQPQFEGIWRVFERAHWFTAPDFMMTPSLRLALESPFPALEPFLGAERLMEFFDRLRVAAPDFEVEVDADFVAERMRGDSRLEAAAHYLVDAEDIVLNSDSELQFPRAIHMAVGSIEEVARQLAGMPTKRLPRVLDELVRRRRISRRQADRIQEAYEIRNQTPGAGHGAGSCPQGVAVLVLFRVKRGLMVLLDAFNIGVVI